MSTIVIHLLLIGMLLRITPAKEPDYPIVLIDRGSHSEFMLNYCHKRCILVNIDDHILSIYGALEHARQMGVKDIAVPYLFSKKEEVFLGYRMIKDKIDQMNREGFRINIGAGWKGDEVDPDLYSRTTVVSTYNWYGRCHPEFNQNAEEFVVGCTDSGSCSTSLATLTYTLGLERAIAIPEGQPIFEVAECDGN